MPISVFVFYGTKKIGLFSVFFLFCFRIVVFEQSPHGNADPLVFDVDVNDLDLNDIANSNNILYIFYPLVSQLRNVNQTVYAVNDLCKCTKWSDGNDGCIDYVILMIICLELLPRVVLGLLIAQRDPVEIIILI